MQKPVMLSVYIIANELAANELTAQHLNIQLVFAVAVCSMLFAETLQVPTRSSLGIRLWGSSS